MLEGGREATSETTLDGKYALYPVRAFAKAG